MNDKTSYRINHPNVTSEEIDGEVLIVNLLNGSYYSAVDLAACVWIRIEGGHSVECIQDELSANFAPQKESIDGDLADFLSKLASESLIVKSANDASPQQAIKQGDPVETKLPEVYTPPVLACYTDMQDLLLLDPIHDVAEVGWPTAKPDADK